MNVLAFIAGLLALILLLVGVHVGWVPYVLAVGVILLSAGGSIISAPFWRRTQ